MPENEQGKECYADKTDEEVALLARDGDDQAQEVLLNKYKNFVPVQGAVVFSDRRGP